MASFRITTPGGYKLNVPEASDDDVAKVMGKLRDLFAQYGGAWLGGSMLGRGEDEARGHTQWIPSTSEIQVLFDGEMPGAAQVLLLK